MRILFFITLLVIITGCTDSKYNNHVEQLLNSMSWLNSANPINDAVDAYNEKDFRYLAITGYSLSIPGLPTSMISVANDQNKFKIIGNCEVTEGQKHLNLCKLANKYAESYNIKLLNLRTGKSRDTLNHPY